MPEQSLPLPDQIGQFKINDLIDETKRAYIYAATLDNNSPLVSRVARYPSSGVYRYVLKVCRDDNEHSWENRAIIQDEALCFSDLSSQKGIVDALPNPDSASNAERYLWRVNDTKSGSEVLFLVLEELENTIADWVPEGGLDILQALKIAHELAKTLRDIHNREISHTDFKHRNVGICKSVDHSAKPKIVLLDFNNRKKLGSYAVPNTTLRWMLPELQKIHRQAVLEGVDAVEPVQVTANWDLYGWGALLYFMITGKLLPEGSFDSWALLKKEGIAEDPIFHNIESTDIQDKVFSGLNTILTLTLKDLPKDLLSAKTFVQDTKELIETLEATSTHAAVSTPPPVPPLPRRPASNHQPGKKQTGLSRGACLSTSFLATLLGAAALSLATLFMLILFRSDSSSPIAPDSTPTPTISVSPIDEPTASFTETSNAIEPLATSTLVPTATPTDQEISATLLLPAETKTSTPTKTPITPTSTAMATSTPNPTLTNTPTVPTDTPTAKPATPVPTESPTATSTATDTPTATATDTPTATATSTATATGTPTATATATPEPTVSFTPTVTLVPVTDMPTTTSTPPPVSDPEIGFSGNVTIVEPVPGQDSGVATTSANPVEFHFDYGNNPELPPNHCVELVFWKEAFYPEIESAIALTNALSERRNTIEGHFPIKADDIRLAGIEDIDVRATIINYHTDDYVGLLLVQCGELPYKRLKIISLEYRFSLKP